MSDDKRRAELRRQMLNCGPGRVFMGTHEVLELLDALAAMEAERDDLAEKLRAAEAARDESRRLCEHLYDGGICPGPNWPWEEGGRYPWEAAE